jgi:hypothetical protein
MNLALNHAMNVTEYYKETGENVKIEMVIPHNTALMRATCCPCNSEPLIQYGRKTRMSYF